MFLISTYTQEFYELLQNHSRFPDTSFFKMWSTEYWWFQGSSSLKAIYFRQKQWNNAVHIHLINFTMYIKDGCNMFDISGIEEKYNSPFLEATLILVTYSINTV